MTPTTSAPVCPTCGGAVPLATGGPGRPRRFCSVGCRRAGEYSIRRLQARLERLETEAEAARRDRTGFFDTFGASPEQRAADIKAEIDAAEAKLRQLLGALAGED
jgi:endogenous inhibitor of DNA gyrase (YacG/DUF329 family)